MTPLIPWLSHRSPNICPLSHILYSFFAQPSRLIAYIDQEIFQFICVEGKYSRSGDKPASTGTKGDLKGLVAKEIIVEG